MLQVSSAEDVDLPDAPQHQAVMKSAEGPRSQPKRVAIPEG